MSKRRFSRQIYAKLQFSWQMFEKYSSTKFHEIPSMRTDGQTDMTKLIVAFRNLMHLSRSHFLSTLTKHKVSKTQLRNFLETRLLAVALNQTDSKQRNKIFTICFESRIMEI
jgi:HD-like signal output (HDOD) protein